jgi:hypothetical protein
MFYIKKLKSKPHGAPYCISFFVDVDILEGNNLPNSYIIDSVGIIGVLFLFVISSGMHVCVAR